MDKQYPKKQNGKLKEKFKQFYLEDCYPMIKLFDRPFFMSLFLVLFKHFQYFLLQLTPDIMNQIIERQSNASFMSYGIYFQDNNVVEMVFVYGMLFFNCYVLFTFLFYLFRKIYWEKSPKEDYFLSVSFQIYYYIIYMISGLCSLLQISKNPIPSSINLVFTIILAFIQSFHEYDDRFIRSDYLSMRSSWQRNIASLLELLSIFLYIYIDGNQLLTANIIFYLVLLAIELYYIPIYNQQIQAINVFGYLFNISSNINTYLILNTNFWRLYLYGLIMCIPLCFKVAQNIIFWRVQLICLKQVSSHAHIDRIIGNKNQSISTETELNQLDLFLRTIYEQCKLDYDEYLVNYSSIYLENISSIHKQYCQKYPYCFCAEDISSQLQRESTKLRSQYLFSYIEQTYQQVVEQNSQKQLCNLIFSYLMFVIEVQQNDTKAITIALNYLQNKKQLMTLFQQQRLLYVLNYINQKVKNFNMQFEISNKPEKKHLDFIESINYDSDMYKSCILFQQCLLMKKVALQKMGMNNVDLQQIEHTFLNLREKREELQNILLKQLNRYHQSYILHYLIDIFEKSLQCDETLSQKLQQLKKLFHSGSVMIGQKQTLGYYSEDSCVIYITLLQNIGIVKKVTKNLFEVVPILQPNEAIGKNINYMIPLKIAQVHNDILNNFIQKQKVDFQIKDYTLIIGIDHQGWAIPYQMKLQTCLIGIDDFGACTWVKQIKDTNFYLMTSYDNNFEILTVSQQIYDVLLKDAVSKNNLLKIKIGSLMPTLDSFIKKKCNSTNYTYDTIIVKPKNENFCYSKTNFKKDTSLIIDIFEMDMFRIKADFNPFFHSCVDFVQIKIYQFERIIEYQQRLEAIKQLLSDFEQFEMFDLDYLDSQKLSLQNYLIQLSNNRNKEQHDQYILSDNRVSNSKSSSSNQSQPTLNTPRLSTVQDTNEDQAFQTDINQLNQIRQTQQKQQISDLAKPLQIQKNSLIDLEKIENKGLKSKSSFREYSQNKLSYRQTQNQINLQSSNQFQDQNFDSNAIFDLISPVDTVSQLQVVSPTLFQSTDMLNSPHGSNQNFNYFQNTPHLRNNLNLGTPQSKADTIDSSYQLELISVNRKSLLSTQYQPRLSQRNSSLSYKLQIQIKQLQQNQTAENTSKGSKSQLKNQKSTYFFNQNAQQSLSSQNYFENDSKNFSRTNFQKQNTLNSKKSFAKNINEGSVHTSAKTGSSNKKAKLIKELRQPSKMTGLKVIKYVGFLTLLAMVLLNILSFISLNTYLQNQKDDYQNIDWASKVQIILTQLTGSQGIVEILEKNPQYLQQQEEINLLLTDIKVQQKEQMDLFYDLILEYQDNKVTNGQLFNVIYDEKYELIFVYDPNRKIKTLLRIPYSLKNIMGYLYQIVENQDEHETNIVQLQMNLIQLNDKLDDINDKIKSAINNIFQDIKDSILSSQIADSIASFFFSLSFIPIFMYVQKKRQEILSLLSTFGPEKIQIMIDTILSCEQGLQKLKLKFNQGSQQFMQNDKQNQIYAHANSVNLIGQAQSNFIQKKKNISSTSQLPMFKASVILYALIFTTVNLIYSYGIGISLTPFIQNQLDNLEFTDKIYQIHHFMSKLIGYRMQEIQCKLDNQIEIYNLYQPAGAQLQLNITTQLNQFYDIVNKQDNISRFKQDHFNLFVNNLMQKDACTESFKNIQYIVSQGYDIQECRETSGHILQKGMIAAIKYFAEVIRTSQSYIEESDITQFKQNLSLHFKEHSLSEYFYYQSYQSYMVEIIRGFVKDLTLEQYSLYLIINIILICFQIFFFIIAVILIYLRFYSQCFNSILQTKRLLDIIDISFLRDNQYVVSYFKSLK